jgi:hypothetical protein
VPREEANVANNDHESLPSNTSEELADSGVNLEGIDREIVPNPSMAIKNPIADGGKWNLISSSKLDLIMAVVKSSNDQLKVSKYNSS